MGEVNLYFDTSECMMAGIGILWGSWVVDNQIGTRRSGTFAWLFMLARGMGREGKGTDLREGKFTIDV